MDGYVVIGTEIDTKGFDKQIKELEYQLKQIDYELSHKKELKLDSRTISEYEAKAQKLANQIERLREKQQAINTTKFDAIKNSADSVGSSIENVIHKITRWGLAIFGIRSAYMFIRQEMSLLSQYDSKIGADLEYMRWAIAQALAPVIQKIIQLAYKLLVYTAYIVKAWTGIDLFANASAKAFERAKESTGGTAKNLKSAGKAARDLKKTLAGFDEMNILQKDGSVASGGGGGGIGGSDFTSPSVDLADWQNVEIPGWVDWIAKNKDLILGFLKEAIILIGLIKLAKLINDLVNIRTALNGLTNLQLVGVITGIALAITGLITLVRSLIKFIKDPSWRNFTDVLKGLSLTLIGVSVALLALNAANPLGWIIAGVGIVTGLVAIFGKLFTTNKKNTVELKNSTQATKDLKKAQEELTEATSSYTSAVKNAEQRRKELIKAEKESKLSGKALFEQVQLGVLDYKKMNAAQRTVFDAYVANLEAEKKLTEETNKFTRATEKANAASGTLSGAIYTETGNFDNYFKTLSEGYRNGKIDSKTYTQAIINMYNNMDKKSKETFMKNLPQDLKNGVTLSKANFMDLPKIVKFQLGEIQTSAKQTFEKDIPNSIYKSLDESKYKKKAEGIKSLFTKISDAIKAAENTTISIKSKNTGKKNAKGAIYLPKLAVGGIINLPGKGMPLGTAIGGERGAEGVIPLTDSQQMSLLGEAIGKYISINATVPVYVGNRQIAREIRKINAEDDFAFNR